jgi:hypothetical protein
VADIKSAYGTAGQTLTSTWASLTNNSARSSAAIDNTSNKYLEALVQVVIKSGASGTSATGYVEIFAYGTVDSGTTYPEGTGTDTGITLTAPTNLVLIGTLNVVANATTYKSEPMSIAAAFGGIMPDHWGIAIRNVSGGTLDTTEGNHAKLYQGLYSTAA